MKIKDYIEQYTANDTGCPIIFKNILEEVWELIEVLIKLKKKKIKEEFSDVLHVFQIWLYNKFGLNGNIWKLSQYSVDKCMKRIVVWRKIYDCVGLDKNISNFSGNYKKLHKVEKQFSRFGICKKEAKKAYKEIVCYKTKKE